VQPLSVNEIRERFLAFFEGKGHMRLPSFSLIPRNDNSLLLIGAGMAPMKPFFTGQETPPSPRVTTCQKCIRTVDIDDVGRDDRHGSFFQMLGNFSFGDYTKADVIPWAWDFITNVLEVPVEKLYVSVYEEDEKAYELWQTKIGLAAERIFKLGKDDNFWEVGVGPCGPCSEIHFDRGEKYGCGSPGCAVGCDCDRYMEIWNLVFIEYEKTESGTYEKLAVPGIDTGMGLDRIAMVMQEKDSIFDIDTVNELKNEIKKMGDSKMSVNIIADHVRTVVFMAADGILPSNEGRGYILRRLLRRAVRHARLLGQSKPFIERLVPLVVEENGGAYPELRERQAHVLQVLTNEESRFFDTLETGMNLLEEQCGLLRKSGGKFLPGAEAFRLYDTFGFPPELTKEMLADEGFGFDEDGFAEEMANQRKRAREARGTSNYMGADKTVFHQLDAGLTTEFVGYGELETEAKVLAIIPDGDEVAVFLDKTPFYAESGGQKGDKGVLVSQGGKAEIRDCIKVGNGKTAHIGKVTEGSISVGDKLTAKTDEETRQATARNHTATHLLAKALRKVLGSHIEQAGSEVSADRLRFDFTHFSGVSAEDMQAIEDDVNASIFANLSVTVTEMPFDEARKAGAVMLMGEKGEQYSETVRVVNIGEGHSIELCGGTHLQNTAQAGLFKLTGENSVAAGVRRIEATTGTAALAQYRAAETQLREAAAALKTTPDQLTVRSQAITNELRQAKQELEKMKAKMAAGQSLDLLAGTEEYGGLTWLTAKLPDLDTSELRNMGDELKQKVDVLLLASAKDSVQFVAHVSEKAVKAGVHAGQMVKEAATVCGGNGGGRPNSAQAGGKDVSKADEALAAGITQARGQLNV